MAVRSREQPRLQHAKFMSTNDVMNATPPTSDQRVGQPSQKDEHLTRWIDDAGLNLQRYDDRHGFYNSRVHEADLEDREEALLKLIRKAIDNHLNA